MTISWSAYNCTNRHFKGTEIKFHRFPLNNEELCKKWIVATKRDNVVPTMASYICSKHFTTDDYRFSDSKKVKEGSIPSVFNFPEHLQSSSSKRKLPATRITMHKENTSAFTGLPQVLESPGKSWILKSVLESP